MSLGFWRGAAAGAAGTTVLNLVTYLDMALRGRPSSSTPQQLVEAVASRLNVSIPGSGQERDNRLSGLGPIAGILVGSGVGAFAGVVHHALGGRRVPTLLAAALVGGAAMALSDVPLAKFGISDPKTWAGKDWLADALPHLAYGLVTVATVRAVDA